MAGIIRDMQCGLDVARMVELGRYGEEFLVYGFSWMEDGRRYYYLSSDGMQTYRTAWQKKLAHQWTTPVESYLLRQTVPSGRRQDLYQETKLMLGKQLEKQYSCQFFSLVADTAAEKRESDAFAVLQSIQRQLEGGFDRDRLTYFQSLVESVLIAKKITTNQYEQLQRWLQKNFKQMENDIFPEEQYDKTFGGFCYRKPKGKWKVYVNAQPGDVFKEWENCMKMGMQVFPIFWKRYSFASMSEGRQLRDVFKQAYVEILEDTGFGEKMLEIKQLKPTIDESAYQYAHARLEGEGTLEEKAAFYMLGSCWDVFLESK